MAMTLDIDIARVTPAIDAVLAGQGIPTDRSPGERTLGLAQRAMQTYRELAHPRGLTAEIESGPFEELYRGEGLNADETPLEAIVSRADRLCLFAVTLGEPICTRISELFETNDFAAGAMLDAAASAGADLAAEILEVDYEEGLRRAGALDQTAAAMRFSPGYCGWHVSGQKKLFAHLRPESIDIELGESCLMRPLKSVSGVIVAGPKQLFDIDDTYPFCADCSSHSCRDRFESLQKRQTAK